MSDVVIYTRPGCHLCDEAREGILALRADGLDFELREVDIDTDDELHARFLERIPVGAAAIPSLNFSHVTAALTCHDAVCDITDFKADGPDGTITAQGRVLLRETVQASALDLTVTLLAGAGWAQKAGTLPIPPLPPGTSLTVKLAGSVANPKLTL